MNKSLTILIITCILIAGGIFSTGKIANMVEVDQYLGVSPHSSKIGDQEFVMSSISVELENQAVEQQSEVGGVVYFVLASAGKHQLVHLPGSCVSGDTNCPEPEPVETPFDPRLMMGKLDWSPDGTKALTFVISEQETDWGIRQAPPSILYLFDAEEETWTKLFESSQSLLGGGFGTHWSNSGDWIAFTARPYALNFIKSPDTLNIIRPDGSDWEMFFSPATPLFAWADDKLFFLALDPIDRESLQMLQRSFDPASKEIEVLFPNNNFALPSPDGEMFASRNNQAPSSVKELRFLDISGNLLQAVAFPGDKEASFSSKEVISPIVWAGDSSLLAVGISDLVYVVDFMNDPMKIFQADSSNAQADITDINFSPDNKSLLLVVDDGTQKIIHVSIDDQVQHTLTWPEQGDIDQLYNPSWRPPLDS